MTPEERGKFIDEAFGAGFNEGEIDGMLRDMGEKPALQMDQPLGRAGLAGSIASAQTIIPGITAGVGGTLGRMALEQVAPKALPYLGPLASGAGAAGGAFLGGLATGQTPQQAATGAAMAGGAGLAVEGGLQMLGHGLSRAGKVTPRTFRETAAEGGVARARTAFGGVGEEEYINEAEALRRLSTKARVEQSPGRQAAEAKIRAFDEAHQVPYDVAPEHPLSLESIEKRYNAGEFDTRLMKGGRLNKPEDIMHEMRRETEAAISSAPIKQRILSMVDRNATQSGRIAVNNQLKALADRLPDRWTMDEFDSFIREHTEPVKGQINNLEATLPTGVQNKIVASARRYRNALLPGARSDFQRASAYMKATKNIRSQLVNKEGDLKKTAENVWRSIPRNKVVLRSFQEYDRVHGTHFADNALDLARRSNWSPGDQSTALGMIDASVGWWGRATAATTRFLGKLSTTAAIPAGRVAAAGASSYNAAEAQRAFENAMRNSP